MPRKPKGGRVTHRLRLKVPGWRSGIFDLRTPRSDVRTFNAWSELIRTVHSEGYFDILDAIADGTIGLPAAKRLQTERGLVAVRRRIQEIEEEERRRAEEGNFPRWLAEFLETKPRRDCSDQQHIKIGQGVQLFMESLVERHGLKGTGEITIDHWTKDNLQAHRTAYVRAQTKKATNRLEEAWAAMENPLPPVEREEILRKERGKKERTANHHVNYVGAFSQWLIDGKRLTVDPSQGLRMSPKAISSGQTEDRRSLKDDEQDRFFSWSKTYDEENPSKPGSRPDTLFWQWLTASGATTYTEGIRVCLAHIGEADETGTVPVHLVGSKNSARARDVYISAKLAEELKARAAEMELGRYGLIFPFSSDNGRTVWEGIMRLISQRDPDTFAMIGDATPYALRHTYATNCLNGGINIMQLKDLMGHASIATTAIYLRGIDPPRAALREVFEARGL